MRTILLLWFNVFLAASAAATDLGTRFEFSIPPNFRPSPQETRSRLRSADSDSSDLSNTKPLGSSRKSVRIGLTITGFQPCTVSITAGELLDTTVEVPAESTVEILLPEQLETVDAATHLQTPIRVASTEEIRLLVVSHRFQTTEAFSVLPAEMYGTRYVLASYDRLGPDLMSQASITTIDQPAQVMIVKDDAILQELAIPPHSSYLLEATASINDLTGVEIRSSAPVSVITGHRCAYVPAKVEACNVLLEHLPPVNTLGRAYVIPIRPDLAPMRCRLIAAGQEVRVTVGDASYVIKPGSFEEIAVSTAPLLAVGDVPFLVALYTQGFKSSRPEDSLQLPDPSMVIVPPVGAGRPRSTLSITNPFKANYQVAIMGSVDALTGLAVNGIPAQESVRLVGNGWGLVTTWAEPGRLDLRADGPVTAVVWSTGVDVDSYDGYAFTVGW